MELREHLLDLAIDAMGVIRADGTVAYASPAAARVFGYDADDLVGQQILAYIHPDDYGASLSAMAVAASAPGLHEPLEVRARHADGHWLHIEVRANSQLDHPVIDGIILEVRDVTDRRLAEERFRLAFEHAPSGMAIVDPSGTWLRVNGSLARILGTTEAELLGHPLEDFVHADDRAGASALCAQAMEPGVDAADGEHRWSRPDGRIVWANVSLAAVRAPDDTPLYGVLQLEDVTERRRLRTELERRARLDDLTGLPNRAEALGHLERLTDELQHRWLGVLFVDLDGFKGINDREGHAAGDAALVAVAERLRGAVRGEDQPARLAGDEFVVCCGDVGSSEEEAESALRAIGQRVVDAVGADGRLSASVGGIVAAAAGCDTALLLAQADAAMYEAKLTGGGRLVVAAYVPAPA